MAKTSPGEFIRQVRTEIGKVVWPTRQETVQTATMLFDKTSLTTNLSCNFIVWQTSS